MNKITTADRWMSAVVVTAIVGLLGFLYFGSQQAEARRLAQPLKPGDSAVLTQPVVFQESYQEVFDQNGVPRYETVQSPCSLASETSVMIKFLQNGVATVEVPLWWSKTMPNSCLRGRLGKVPLSSLRHYQHSVSL